MSFSPIVSGILDNLFFFLAFVSEYRRIVISSLARSPQQFPRNLSSPLIVRSRHLIAPPLEIEIALLLSFYPPVPFPYFPSETRKTLYRLIYVLPNSFYDLRYLSPVSFIYLFDTGNQNTALSPFHFYYENFFHFSLSEYGLPSNICSSRRTHSNKKRRSHNHSHISSLLRQGITNIHLYFYVPPFNSLPSFIGLTHT